MGKRRRARIFSHTLASNVQMYNLCDLIPQAEIRRPVSPETVQQVERTILEYGVIAPILIYSDGKIVAGHLRYEIAKKMRMDELPVIILDKLSAAKARNVIITENRLRETTFLDDGQIRDEIEKIGEATFGVYWS